MISTFRIQLIISAMLLAVIPAHASDSARSFLRKGVKAYEKENYSEAVQFFEKAAPSFPAEANFDLGNAYYRMNDFEQATNCYHKALETDDLELQAQAYYNLGNAVLSAVNITNYAEKASVEKAVDQVLEAMELYESSLRLEPENPEAKQNLERAMLRRLDMEFEVGKSLFDQGEALLSEFKAKEAQTHYTDARTQFEHILADIDPNNAESKQFLPKIEERLSMLERAVQSAEQDLEAAYQLIRDYQYRLAAQRLATESDDRKYAFDLKPELKKKYEETIQKNQEILSIIEGLSTQNTVE